MIFSSLTEVSLSNFCGRAPKNVSVYCAGVLTITVARIKIGESIKRSDTMAQMIILILLICTSQN